jgi:hypothetical protein
MTMTRLRALSNLFSYARRYLFMQDKPQVIGFLRSVVEKDRGTRLGIEMRPLTSSGVAPRIKIIILPK